MRVLYLRLEGPLMSFGGPKVDDNYPTMPFPGRAMLAGLLGSALRYEHGDFGRLQALQDGLGFSARVDRVGCILCDYHTIDLRQEHMWGSWTTGGRAFVLHPRYRGQTHQTYRAYWQDAAITCALTSATVALDDLAAALRAPTRPLFLGRKSCPPSVPIYAGCGDHESLAAAALEAPRPQRCDAGPEECLRVWPRAPGEPTGHPQWIVDDRDWANQVHAGRRSLWLSRHCQSLWLLRPGEEAGLRPGAAP